MNTAEILWELDDLDCAHQHNEPIPSIICPTLCSPLELRVFVSYPIAMHFVTKPASSVLSLVIPRR